MLFFLDISHRIDSVHSMSIQDTVLAIKKNNRDLTNQKSVHFLYSTTMIYFFVCVKQTFLREDRTESERRKRKKKKERRLAEDDINNIIADKTSLLTA